MPMTPRERTAKRLLTNVPRTYLDLRNVWLKADGKRTDLRRRANLLEARWRKAATAHERVAEAAPTWIDILVRPMAERMAEVLDADVEVLGPFGISCEVAIHVYSKGTADHDRRMINCRSLTLRPDGENCGLHLVDYSVDTGDFEPGTLGHMNGLHHPTSPVPNSAGVDWFIAQLR